MPFGNDFRRRDFLAAGAAGLGVFAESSAVQAAAPETPVTPQQLSLWPLDARCVLLSNVLWTPDSRGGPTLSKQHLWVRFPSPLVVSGAEFVPVTPLGQIRFETTTDEGRTWRLLSKVFAPSVRADGAGSFPTQSVRWTGLAIDNIRIVVDHAENAYFPFGEYFTTLKVFTNTLEFHPAEAPLFRPLARSIVASGSQPVAGSDDLRIHERSGACHQPPRTDRVQVTTDAESVYLQSNLMHVAFSRRFALVRSLGWDMGQRSKQGDNLLSSHNTQGAFPIVARDCRRLASDVAGGELILRNRSILYRRVRVVPELEQSLEFLVREDGFTLTIESRCTRTFRTHEVAALRLPFDLYQCVTSVLGIPETIGPSGLVRLPLVIQAPNHGAMRVTVVKADSSTPVYGRVIPFRVHAELWLDLIVGARPLENGLFEVGAGHTRTVLEFELTKIYPFANTDIFSAWRRAPFYSFVDREQILGALPNEWLSGVPFRPDMRRFANNSVAEPVPLSAGYHGEMAAYTPDLAPGLKCTDLIRCAADSILRDFTVSAFAFTDYTVFPQTLASPIDLAWLTVAATGDWNWAAQHRYELKEWARRMLSREYRATGLIYADASGNPGEGRGTMWMDSVRSGHLESYVTAFCARAALRNAELLDRIGENNVATNLRAMHQRARENYWRTFYDPSKRRIAMWVDRRGDRHGFDCFAHLGAAIVCDFAPGEIAPVLLSEYLGRVEATGFTQYQHGLPLVLDPIPASYHQDWFGKGVEQDGTDAYGVYQNGSICHFHLYYLFQALYRSGLRKKANTLWMKVTPRLRQGQPGISGPLHSGMDWTNPDGSPSGYEGLLAEQHHFLVAAVTGYLGYELTIDGLRYGGQDSRAASDRAQAVRPNFARLAEGTKR